MLKHELWNVLYIQVVKSSDLEAPIRMRTRMRLMNTGGWKNKISVGGQLPPVGQETWPKSEYIYCPRLLLMANFACNREKNVIKWWIYEIMITGFFISMWPCMYSRQFSIFWGNIDFRLVTTFQHGANTLNMEDTSHRERPKWRKDLQHRQRQITKNNQKSRCIKC